MSNECYLNVVGMPCPDPIVKLAQKIERPGECEVITLITDNINCVNLAQELSEVLNVKAEVVKVNEALYNVKITLTKTLLP